MTGAEEYLLTDFEDKSEYLSVQLFNDNAANVCLESTVRRLRTVVSCVPLYRVLLFVDVCLSVVFVLLPLSHAYRCIVCFCLLTSVCPLYSSFCPLSHAYRCIVCFVRWRLSVRCMVYRVRCTSR